MSVWSVRFGQGRGPGWFSDYEVPAGKRAVVRFVSAASFGSFPAGAYVFIQGVAVLNLLLTASSPWHVVDCRFTAYEGEFVHGEVYGPDVAMHLSGFLLDASGDFSSPSARSAPIETVTPDLSALYAARQVERDLEAGLGYDVGRDADAPIGGVDARKRPHDLRCSRGGDWPRARHRAPGPADGARHRRSAFPKFTR